ncbi:subtilase family protease [Saccharomonospora marina XMU15]|uniref:Subtilase family protease n=1 Tax=Saccharomonospora marina XMU15 TaxID=882083 RepID=H5X841_9PSEU|nr:subtilase family protease [Saccharomonospora marina XMU15]
MFKISATARPDENVFARQALQVLGETIDYTYFVLASDQGDALGHAIDVYRRTGDMRSFFALIDDIEPYGPEDRRGPGISELGDRFPGRVVIDIGIWVAGTRDEAVARVQTVENVLARTGDTILLRSVSARRTYLRAEVTAEGLANMLDTSVVEFVRTPPVPFLDFRDWWNAGATDVRRVEKPGAVVGVLDDAPATAHPLLDGIVLSVESLAPASYAWQQPGSHGTEVAGRVLYPHLAEELRDLRPLSSVGAVRAVRILEPDPHRPNNPPRFATYAVPHELIGTAIRHLHSQHGVKVINLSVGYDEPFNDAHLGALTETIDDLARELDIVLVVPTGNVGIDLHARTPSGHHILDDKPEYFFTPEHRLAEPGPAALALTVGSIAMSGAPAEMPNRFGWRTAAGAGEASAFSRSGPGLGTNSKRANKPDIVHFGGNIVLNDSGHPVLNDPGASVVTPSSRHTDGRLFAAVNGTSFAAPAVARVAADVAHAYPDASANLIRALVGSSATHPAPAEQLADTHRRLRVYGLGTPHADRAIDSDRNRVTMTFDGKMSIDTVQIHPLPIPELFRRGHQGGERTITVALAFDPPVRRQRREYLAGTMKVDIYRNIDPDELAEILIRQDPDDPRELINDLRRLKLEPGSSAFTNATLQVRSWKRKQTFVDDTDTFYVVATHKAQTWARGAPEYTHQRYALAVTLEDQHLVQADLRELLIQRVHNPARVRVRA